MEPAEGSHGQKVRATPGRGGALGPGVLVTGFLFPTEMLPWMWSPFTPSAPTGREVAGLLPAALQTDLGQWSLLPGRPLQWSLGHTPYSGAMLFPLQWGSLKPPEQRCQIPHGILNPPGKGDCLAKGACG